MEFFSLLPWSQQRLSLILQASDLKPQDSISHNYNTRATRNPYAMPVGHMRTFLRAKQTNGPAAPVLPIHLSDPNPRGGWVRIFVAVLSMEVGGKKLPTAGKQVLYRWEMCTMGFSSGTEAMNKRHTQVPRQIP